MGNTENYIEINGKKYDAVTGAMIGSHATAPAPNVHKTVVDGFVKPRRDVSNARPTTVSNAKHHKPAPQRSKTLMRSVVKKPTTPLLNNQQPVAKKVFTPKATIVPRVQTTPANRERLAGSVKKSDFVQKFASTAPNVSAPTMTVTPLQVRPAPPQVNAVPATTKPHAKTSELLEKALLAAEGHNETYKEPKNKLHHAIARKIGVNARTIVVSFTVLAGIVAGGLYAYQNVPNLAMRVASSRAGFDAALPDYNPSGFAFSGPVQYAAGQVSVGFKSNTDEREYKLTQKTTDWSSESLLNNFLLSNNKQYQTYQDKGRTIYIYDDNNATWVDGGVWYQIEGKSQLTTDQLIRIATSL